MAQNAYCIYSFEMYIIYVSQMKKNIKQRNFNNQHFNFN